MLHKTKGIILSQIPYRETSIVVKIYTERFGVQTYIENSVRKAKGKNKMALFQPLTLLELVVYYNQKKDIQRISEIKCPHPLTSVPFEIKKMSIGIFLNEILNKCLKEESENEALFFFLYQSILSLDELNHEVENFHIKFLAQLSVHLGFRPLNAKEIETQFYQSGLTFPFTTNTYDTLNLLLNCKYEDRLLLSNELRSQILSVWMAFYRLHVENFGRIKSVEVLSEVLQ